MFLRMQRVFFSEEGGWGVEDLIILPPPPRKIIYEWPIESLHQKLFFLNFR